MTEPKTPQFRDRDLTGAVFENVRLVDGRFRQVRFDGSTFESISFGNLRMKAVQIFNTEISGDVYNVVINGVDIGPLIEAELNRRDPQRPLVYQVEREEPSIADYREGWDTLGRRWAATIERVRAMPEGSEHEPVDGEWSLVQTLRHVSYAVAAWIERVAMGRESPFAPTDLPWDQAPDSIPRVVDRDARVPLDDAVTQWQLRWATVRDYLAGLTDEELRDARVTVESEGFPQVTNLPVREAVHIALTETWEHHGFAERDLTTLTS